MCYGYWKFTYYLYQLCYESVFLTIIAVYLVLVLYTQIGTFLLKRGHKDIYKTILWIMIFIVYNNVGLWLTLMYFRSIFMDLFDLAYIEYK